MRLTRAARVAALALALAAGAAFAGCGTHQVRSPTAAVMGGGDQTSGRDAIVEHGCGACHRIPGIAGARALVGPPLDGWSNRSFIAGTLTNSADNLTLWLADPRAVREGSAMPDLDLTEAEIADIVAYLFSIE